MTLQTIEEASTFRLVDRINNGELTLGGLGEEVIQAIIDKLEEEHRLLTAEYRALPDHDPSWYDEHIFPIDRAIADCEDALE